VPLLPLFEVVPAWVTYGELPLLLGCVTQNTRLLRAKQTVARLAMSTMNITTPWRERSLQTIPAGVNASPVTPSPAGGVTDSRRIGCEPQDALAHNDCGRFFITPKSASVPKINAPWATNISLESS
jgi:hypothetical protein